MKVLFVNSLYKPHELGGAERSVRELAESLVEQGHQAVVVSLAPDGTYSTGEVDGVRTHYLPLANVHWPFEPRPRSFLRRAIWHVVDACNLVMASRVGTILDQEKPDLMQTDNLRGFSVAVWWAAKRRGIPVVHMLHDYYSGCANSSMFRRGANCQKQCTSCKVLGFPRRKLSNIPEAVISVSHRTLARLEQCGLFSDVPTKLAVGGVNSVRVDIPERENLAADEPLTIGFLGRIEPIKGVEVLLDAIAGLPQEKITVLLAADTSSDFAQALQARYASPNVQFLGYCKPADLFNRIDLLVVPSLWEDPLPRVIYEAFEYGIPVAASRAGGMPEIIEEGKTGFLFEPGDSAALAALLRQQIEQGLQARHYFPACRTKSREFTRERQFARIEIVWKGAIGTAAAAPKVPA